jgi:hypothetical protein
VTLADVNNNSKIDETDHVFGGNNTEDDYKQTSPVSTDLSNNNEQIDITQYVQNLQSRCAKRTIYRFLSEEN